ncbi:hypothetical protein Tco_1424955, partial [Tanacetum coccineum]
MLHSFRSTRSPLPLSVTRRHHHHSTAAAITPPLSSSSTSTTAAAPLVPSSSQQPHPYHHHHFHRDSTRGAFALVLSHHMERLALFSTTMVCVWLINACGAFDFVNKPIKGAFWSAVEAPSGAVGSGNSLRGR